MQEHDVLEWSLKMTADALLCYSSFNILQMEKVHTVNKFRCDVPALETYGNT